MKIKTLFLLVFAIIFLVNEAAFARAGGRSFGGGRSSYSNQGSRGSRTYDGGSANGKSYSGMDKSTTANNGNNQNTNSNNYNNNQQPSFFQRNPLMSTFGAAIAGTWIGSMLFGSHTNAAQMVDANGQAIPQSGGMFSGMMPILLIGLLIWIVIKFANRSKNLDGTIFDTNKNQPNPNNNYQSNHSGNVIFETIDLPEIEKQKFSEILAEVQSAWSNQDTQTLKRLTTPEISKYFSDALAQNQSQDLHNKVENLKVLSVTISEAWEEDHLHYATALLKWSALDYTINTTKNPIDPLYVTEGDMKNPSETSEAWTFTRYGKNSNDGRWILSAIAQVS